MFRWTAYAGIGLILAITLVYFHPLLALWVTALAVLTRLYPTYGLLLLFLSVPIDVTRPTYQGIIISLSELEFAACLLAWLSGQELAKLRFMPLLWGAPFLIATALSSIVGIDWHKILPHLLRASEIFLMLFLVMEVYRGKGRTLAVKIGLAIAGLLFSVSGLLQFTPMVDVRLVSGTRVFSFFTHPNQFAAYLNLLLPFFFFFILTSPRQKARLFWIYLFFLGLIAQLSTLSRAAPLALACALLAMSLAYFGPRLRKPYPNRSIAIRQWLKRSGSLLAAHLALILLLAALILPFTSVGSRMTSSLENVMARSEKGVVGTLIASRLPYWELGFRIWKDHSWVGIGPGRYEEAASEYVGSIEQYRGRVLHLAAFESSYRTHAHNLFLQIAVVYGLLGLAGFLFFCVKLFAKALVQFKTSGDCIAIGLLTAFLIHNLVDVSFPSLALEIGFAAGLALTLGNSDGCNGRGTDSRRWSTTG